MTDNRHNSKPDDKVEGEGSYSATADYNKRTAEFLKKDKVDKAAQEAKRALDSKEAADLKAAEAKGKSGDTSKWHQNPNRTK